MATKMECRQMKKPSERMLKNSFHGTPTARELQMTMIQTMNDKQLKEKLFSFLDEQRRLYLYSLLFLPLRNTVYTDRKLKKIPVISYIFRNSLKLKTNDADMVVCLHAACNRFFSLIPFVESNRDSEIVQSELEDEYLDIPLISRRRVLAGLLLRQIKYFWRVALLMSTLLYPIADHTSDFNGHFDLDRRWEIFLRVESTIHELELDRIWELKPLPDGKVIMGVLQLKTGGPMVKEWQDMMLKWQLAHPEKTTDWLDWMCESQAKRVKLGSFVYLFYFSFLYFFCFSL